MSTKFALQVVDKCGKRRHLNGSVMAAQRLGRSKFFMGAHTAANSMVNSFCVSARAP